MRVTCNVCGGENILQAASIMIDLLDYKDHHFALEREEIQWEDYFYCKDCGDEVTITEEEE
jgi:hypothetical protein